MVDREIVTQVLLCVVGGFICVLGGVAMDKVPGHDTSFWFGTSLLLIGFILFSYGLGYPYLVTWKKRTVEEQEVRA